MNKTIKIIIGVLVALALFGGFMSLFNRPEQAVAAVRTNGAYSGGTYRLYPAITATSSSATSTEVQVSGAKKISLFFNRSASVANATSTFSVLVTVDGTNYFTAQKLIDDVTNTNSQTLTRVASKVLVGTTTARVSLDMQHDAILGLKCVQVVASTSTSACSVLIEY